MIMFEFETNHVVHRSQQIESREVHHQPTQPNANSEERPRRTEPSQVLSHRLLEEEWMLGGQYDIEDMDIGMLYPNSEDILEIPSNPSSSRWEHSERLRWHRMLKEPSLSLKKE